MRLVDASGQTLELAVVGYQFPDLPTAEYDSNWLTVRVDVAHPRGRWSASAPCLLTYEATRLADWLELVAAGQAAPGDEESFTEPCLVFHVSERAGAKTLRVYFELELRPAWAASLSAGEEDLWVDFPLDEVDLAQAARDLRKQLSRYPQRTEH